ncbi:MAG: hypothetical protein ABIG96_01115 [Candidatus Micrarchaeota archaeon]
MPSQEPKKHGQTALEYIMIIGGAILFVVLIVIILRSGILARGVEDIEGKSDDYRDTYLKSYLVFENFNSGTSKKWNSDACDWQVSGGKYGNQISGDCETFVQGYYDNFTLEFKVRNTNPGGAPNALVGAYFRYADSTDNYRVVMSGGTVVLFQGAAAMGAGNPFVSADENDVSVKVVATSSLISVFVEGQKYIEIPSPTLHFGKIGLATFGTTATFDDVRVSRLD